VRSFRRFKHFDPAHYAPCGGGDVPRGFLVGGHTRKLITSVVLVYITQLVLPNHPGVF